MRWLLWRELVLMARTPPVWIAMGFQAALLTCLIVIWGDGVPILSGSFFDQFAVVHFSLLLITLPWVAARCSRGTSRDIALVAAVAAASVRVVVTTRCLALFIVLLATVASGAPMVILAARIVDGDVTTSVRALAIAAAMCAFVAAIVTTSVAGGVNRLPAWGVGTLATLAVASLVPIVSVGIALPLLLFAAGIAGVAALQVGQRLRYPS